MPRTTRTSDQSSDIRLIKILLIIVAAPFILIAVLIISSIVLSYASFQSSSMTTAYLSPASYQDNTRIAEWLTECDKAPAETYALCSFKQNGKEMSSAYLIYRPQAAQATDLSVTPHRGFLNDSLDIYYTEPDNISDTSVSGTTVADAAVSDAPGYQLTLVSYYSDEFLDKLYVYGNDEKIACQTTEVDYDLTCFE